MGIKATLSINRSYNAFSKGSGLQALTQRK
jgi:hypothetical protein